MADKILKDATQLGSTLTSFASRQLDAVLNELRGPAGIGARRSTDDGASLGGLAGNVMQIVNHVGSLLTHLSEYDLVRNEVNKLNLSSANPLSSITTHAGEATAYDLLVENNGQEPLTIKLTPELHSSKQPVPAKPNIKLAVGERTRVSIKLPPLKVGKDTLIISATNSKSVTIAKKTVAVNVLPQVQQVAGKAPASKGPARKKRAGKKRARK